MTDISRLMDWHHRLPAVSASVLMTFRDLPKAPVDAWAAELKDLLADMEKRQRDAGSAVGGPVV